MVYEKTEIYIGRIQYKISLFIQQIRYLSHQHLELLNMILYEIYHKQYLINISNTKSIDKNYQGPHCFLRINIFESFLA